MRNLEVKGFREQSQEELKEVQGGMSFGKAPLGFAVSAIIGYWGYRVAYI